MTILDMYQVWTRHMTLSTFVKYQNVSDRDQTKDPMRSNTAVWRDEMERWNWKDGVELGCLEAWIGHILTPADRHSLHQLVAASCHHRLTYQTSTSKLLVCMLFLSSSRYLYDRFSRKISLITLACEWEMKYGRLYSEMLSTRIAYSPRRVWRLCGLPSWTVICSVTGKVRVRTYGVAQALRLYFLDSVISIYGLDGLGK